METSMEKSFTAASMAMDRLAGQDYRYPDDEDDWLTELDDDLEDLDQFDLGVYAGALK